VASRKRFLVTGTWSGYTSAQCKIVHRTVETQFRAGYEAIGSYRFSDGTTLFVAVRDYKPREIVTEIHGYDKLLRDEAMTKWEAQQKAAS
jgi:hypothetical protein